MKGIDIVVMRIKGKGLDVKEVKRKLSSDDRKEKGLLIINYEF